MGGWLAEWMPGSSQRGGLESEVRILMSFYFTFLTSELDNSILYNTK